MMIPRLAVSIGCPCGVGPEVSVVAALGKRTGARLVLVGDLATLQRAAKLYELDADRLVRVANAEDAWSVRAREVAVWQPTRDLALRDRAPGKPTRVSGAAELAWIDAACDLVTSGGADALVTGPVSKSVIASSAAPGAKEFFGHTEHLQRRLHAREVVMAFWSNTLTTALVTTHLPLAHVPRAITPAAVASSTFWLADLLATLGGKRPRVAVASLNPHAGEGGLLGREEATRIVPGMVKARARLERAGIDAEIVGPVPAETAMRLANAGKLSGVVAMYHDQATIPMKLASFGDAVNVSLGLPIVRTSVDHGTAYDRAGKGTADARGMRAAILLAARLSVANRSNTSATRRSR
jgi:4-hydroxythreonine-4-phosphate dehydrogenase